MFKAIKWLVNFETTEYFINFINELATADINPNADTKIPRPTLPISRQIIDVFSRRFKRCFNSTVKTPYASALQPNAKYYYVHRKTDTRTSAELFLQKQFCKVIQTSKNFNLKNICNKYKQTLHLFTDFSIYSSTSQRLCAMTNFIASVIKNIFKTLTPGFPWKVRHA